MGARLTHWGIPLAAALLPRRAGFALLARAAASDRVRHACEAQALENAKRLIGVLPAIDGVDPRIDGRAWLRDWKLLQFVDNADLFLSATRGERWIVRNVDVLGAWPTRSPFLALSSHWGAGLWALREMRRAGHRARFLLLRVDRDALAADRAYLAYIGARIRAVERATGAPVIYTGGAASEIDAAWRKGTAVVALCDAPPPPGRSTLDGHAGRLAFTMPSGLMRLACERRMPVVWFAARVDRRTGRRRLEIETARVYADPRSMADSIAARLAALIASDSAAWHMWPYASQLIGEPVEAHEGIAT
jgi:hypothetical protein